MKNILILFMTLGLFACSETPRPATETDKEVSLQFLANPNSLKDIDKPIEVFTVGANETAASFSEFKKGNATEALSKAKEYKYAVILVEDHTVVLISNTDDCKESLSWEVCMPMGQGFMKKSKNLVSQNDFVNEIIGAPDNSKRTIFYFN